ncbi:MFS transporter [Salininema proteolyticum]|uniref:Nitrate/nitrite transporter n=1 Tax=Salininema proteolyticum TaxID=1607685 RepID=A0ABV8U2G5_9ACTN
MSMDTSAAQRGKGFNLGVATAVFTLTFWAWNLIGPLSTTYGESLDLSDTQKSVLVAIPVLVGSLGRIPVGAMTDRIGGRRMLAVICFISVVPVIGVAYSDSYAMLLFWGFLLGVAGTSFAVGIPFVNSWYPPEKRGFATGLFGAGMGGTALSAFFTPRLVEGIGRAETHWIMVAALIAMGLFTLFAARNSPGWSPSTESVWPRMRVVMTMRITWIGCLLYGLAFGGFVAFSTYLPTLLQNVYEFSQTGAGMRTAGFSLAAVVARPIGGILADKIGPERVLAISFGMAAVLAVVLVFQPPAEFAAGTTYVLIAFGLGLGTGGVFAMIGQRVDPAKVGTITGLVGAAGGLGGFFPPLVLGADFEATGSYDLGFLALAVCCVVAFVYVAFVAPKARAKAEAAKLRPPVIDLSRRRDIF